MLPCVLMEGVPSSITALCWSCHQSIVIVYKAIMESCHMQAACRGLKEIPMVEPLTFRDANELGRGET